MNKKYRPSNGTEGVLFYDEFCASCERDSGFRMKGEDGCSILAASMFNDYTDKKYPSEWTYDKKGDPTCTAWVQEKTPEEKAREKRVKERMQLEAAGQMRMF